MKGRVNRTTRSWMRIVAGAVFAAAMASSFAAATSAGAAAGTACSCVEQSAASTDVVFEGHLRESVGSRYVFHVDKVLSGTPLSPQPVMLGSCGAKPNAFTRYRIQAMAGADGVADAGFCGGLVAVGKTIPDPRAVTGAGTLIGLAAVYAIVLIVRRAVAEHRRHRHIQKVLAGSRYLTG